VGANGQLYVLAALLPRKQFAVFTEQGTSWEAQQVWTKWTRK